MIIINSDKLNDFAHQKPDALKAVEKWTNLVSKAEWKSHADLKQMFPSADYVGNERYVFNIRGNNYRLIAVVVFVAGILDIRFVGTHKEYDRIDCKTI